MGPWTFFLLNDPDSVRFVLTHHRQYFKKGPGLDRSNPLIGAGLFTQEGEEWVDQRRRLAPVFKPSNVESMRPWMEQAIDRFFHRIPQSQPFDLEESMLTLSLDVGLNTIFADDRHDPAQITEIGDDVRWIMAHFYHRSRSIWRFPYRFPAFNRRYHAHAKRLLRGAHRIMPSPRPFDTAWPNFSPTPALADQEMLTLVVAGYETTGHALAWTLDLLARHSEIADLVYRESLQSEHPMPQTHPWTHQVLLESLRLYPSAWLLSRYPTTSSSFDNLHFEPGNIILISPWLLHHTEDWFENAEQFSPERFHQTPRAYTYIPFGGGARRCIGESFAMNEAMLALSRITRQYRLIPQGSREVFPGLTLRCREPMWVTAERRA